MFSQAFVCGKVLLVKSLKGGADFEFTFVARKLEKINDALKKDGRHCWNQN